MVNVCGIFQQLDEFHYEAMDVYDEQRVLVILNDAIESINNRPDNSNRVNNSNSVDNSRINNNSLNNNSVNNNRRLNNINSILNLNNFNNHLSSINNNNNSSNRKRALTEDEVLGIDLTIESLDYDKRKFLR